MVGQLVPRPNNPPVDLTIRDFKADRALGRADLYSQVANAAATKICGLYGKSPATVARIIPFGSGLIDNSKGVFDDLCEGIAPPPPPPQSPFNGGQCACQEYVVTGDYYFEGNYQRTDTFTTLGPIGAFGLKPGDPTNYGFSRGSSACPLSFLVLISGNAQEIAAGRFQFRNQTVTPVGGASDVCGNPSPSYPPPSATPNDLNGTTIINIAPNVPVTVPVTIVPTFAPVVGIFRPEFNVNVGGINVNISAGGFTFSPTLELPVNDPSPYSDPRSTKPNPLPISPPSSGGTCPDVDLTPVIDKLNELESLLPDDCCTTPAKPDDPKFFNAEIVTLSLESGSVALPDGVYKVRLLLIDRSTKEKIEYGGTQADVVYAGWAWFASQFSLEKRLPIDSPDKQFIPPNKNQNSFVWTCRARYKAQVTVYYKEKR